MYERIAEFVPAPEGVTREGVLRLDRPMLEAWKYKLESTWSTGSDKGGLKTLNGGLSDKMKTMSPK